MTIYAGWWEVPAHLLPATALAELEYPRTAEGQQLAAWVATRDWRDKKITLPLYDARTCPPTKATARQLAAASTTSKRRHRRTCADCGARCQRPLPPLQEAPGSGPLCPACRHIALLRRAQVEAARARQRSATRAAELLTWADAAVVQVDLTIPPPTPSGRKRLPTAAHVRAVDLQGERLVDVLVRLVGPRAHHVPAGAVPRQDAAPTVRRLQGRRLIAWHEPDLAYLRRAAPDLNRADEHAGWNRVYGFPRERVAVLWWLATQWRGQLDPTTRQLVACLPPGAPDRLLLLLRRMAASLPAATVAAGGGGAADSPSAEGYTDLGGVPAGLDPTAPELPNGGVQIGRFTGTPYDGVQLNLHHHATIRAQAYLTPGAAQRLAALLTAAGNPDQAVAGEGR
jgi:hypothetical protein